MENELGQQLVSGLQNLGEMPLAVGAAEYRLSHLIAENESGTLVGMTDPGRLLSYPYVVVRIACTRCSRNGSYRLARLAERYGADIRLTELLELLSADCKLRETKGFVGSHLTCGAKFTDLSGSRVPRGDSTASTLPETGVCPRPLI